MLTDWDIFQIAAGLEISPQMTHEQAMEYARMHPDFPYRDELGIDIPPDVPVIHVRQKERT